MNIQTRLCAAAILASAVVACNKPETLQNHQQDLSREAAEGRESIQDAQREAAADPSRNPAEDVYSIEKEKIDATHEFAKEKCDQLKAAEKDACLSKARVDYDTALAAAQSQRDAATP